MINTEKKTTGRQFSPPTQKLEELFEGAFPELVPNLFELQLEALVVEVEDSLRYIFLPNHAIWNIIGTGTGFVRWALCEHLPPPCHDFACGGLKMI